MATLAERAQSKFSEKAARYGEDVSVGGLTVRAFTRPASVGLVGLQFLGRQGLSAYTPKSDPRQFLFPARSFAPIATLAAPAEGDTIVRGGRGYRVSQVAGHIVDNTLVYVDVFGHRLLMGAANLSPILDAEAARLFRPLTLPRLTDPDTLTAHDAGFDDLGAFTAFFLPLTPEEKTATFGQLDVRANHVFSNDLLQIGDVLYRAALNEAWVIVSPSELQPGAGLIVSLARHMASVPKSIRSVLGS